MHCFKCDIESDGKTEVCNNCGQPLESDADRYFKAGMEAMAAGDVDRAISLLKDCINLNPDHISGRYNLGLALSLADRCDEAMGHYAAIAEENPEHPGIYTALGQAAFGSYLVHVEGAEMSRMAMMEFLMRAVRQDPEDVDALFSLGNAYIAIDKPRQALPWLERALSIHQDSPAIYYTIAKALNMMGEHDEAVEMAERSAQYSSPDDPFWDDIQMLLSELQQGIMHF